MNKRVGTILLSLMFLVGCNKAETEPTATIKDLYSAEAEGSSIGDRKDERYYSRSITDAHPELTAYKPGTEYGAIYLPVFDRCLDSDVLEVSYRDAVSMILIDKEHPTASYILGNLRNYAQMENDIASCNDILPYMTIRRAENEELVDMLLSQIESSQQDQISGKVGTGCRLTLVCGSGYTPTYAYGVFTVDGTLSKSVLMVTDNIVTNPEKSKRQQGQPLEPYVVDSRTNTDGKTLFSVLKDSPSISYSVYQGKTSIAVPSFMNVTEDDAGIDVKVRDDSYTPLDYSGMTVSYGNVPSMNDAVELLKKKAAESFGYSKSLSDIVVSDIHYEENVKYLGADNGTHIYGRLLPQKRNSEMAKHLPGNGHILFDIYQVNKGGNNYTVMFYYGESQKDEVSKWIELNCY